MGDITRKAEFEVAVIGGGIMGSGIAQLAAMAGHRVRVRETGRATIDRAKAAIERSLVRFEKAGKLTKAGCAEVTRRILYSVDFDKTMEGVDVVIEAVPEVAALKQEVLGLAATISPPTTLLATNTSQISITRIASALGDAAERFIGTHFFNPPVMMNLIELICGVRTSPETVQRAREFCEGLGKEVVVCRKDSPGFLTSRAYAILRLECVRMLDEGLATADDIDRAFRLGFNFPMGPLELGDFNGIDTFVQVLDALTEAYGDRFRPTSSLRNMVTAGLHGRKTGRGFYTYDQDGEPPIA